MTRTDFFSCFAARLSPHGTMARTGPLSAPGLVLTEAGSGPASRCRNTTDFLRAFTRAGVRVHRDQPDKLEKCGVRLQRPNLNLLGLREPEIYGTATLADVESSCAHVASELGWNLDFRQTNREGELVDWIQEAGAAQAGGNAVGVVLNAAGYSHTSIALHDAIIGSGAWVVEVHISNVYSREAFRHTRTCRRGRWCDRGLWGARVFVGSARPRVLRRFRSLSKRSARTFDRLTAHSWSRARLRRQLGLLRTADHSRSSHRSPAQPGQ